MPLTENQRKITSNRLLLIKQIIVLIVKTSLALLILLSLIFIIVERVAPELVADDKMKVYSVFRPITSVVNKSIIYIKTFFTEIEYIINSNNYAKRLKKVENEKNKALIKLYKLKQENQSLREALNFIPPDIGKYHTVRLIAQNPGPYIKSAFVKSPQAGLLEKDDVVINNDGLVGQVEAVSGSNADIVLITDKRSNIPVKSRNSGKRAILVGNGTKNPELDFVLSTKHLVVGEEILTSGDGGVFPPDIPVGYIENIKNERIIIESYVDWESLDYVFTVK